ncbi:MAG: oligopeptide transporter, OPT family [Bacteroides sp.]|nr:oligopeptide transporter, OPT family [Bacteroidales bacterium]MCI7462432.1 oligopeptide transporter, OPT family [Bacteroides sp.]MDY2973315.1 oligopeptide transporter, OPT family [Candidatus Cryptobacteroides sp.]
MEENRTSLPENAQRELKPGEKYQPLLSPQKNYPEVTPYSVCVGLLMVILFSAAAAYLGLKVGQVFEAAIPIAIIAVGLTGALGKKGGLGQNVIIQSIGGCSGAVVAGAIFTLPAIYILGVEVNFMQMFLSSLLGGILGILFLIPFRKYFVKEMHGKYPFPEATATTQVLVSGEGGGSNAKTLILSGLVGGLYDFIIATFGAWSETITTTVMHAGQYVADKAKVVLKLNTGAAVLGLGYIVGLKYAFIICCGSFLVWLVIIPLMNVLWGGQVIDLMNSGITQTIGDMSADEIFRNYARHIGIGGIATAGIIGIIKSFGVIKSAVSLAAGEFSKKPGKKEANIDRTDEDISMKIIVFGIIITLLAVFAFFAFGGVVENIWQALIGVLIVGIISFLFTTVAANAIAIVGSNPVSGMTLMTLIIASLILVAVGLKGNVGMAAALVIGGVVCTALSVAGSFVTDLKIGYWIGSSPKKQEIWKFAGVAVAAATVCGVMLVLNKTFGFTGDNALVAPQANAMAAVIQPLMNGGGAPWILYGIGALIAIVLTMCKIPALAFALGMFIPIDLNLPLLVGGAISWFVSTRSSDEKVNAARQEKGTLIASGFIAGGALMGVVSAILKFANVDMYMTEWQAAYGEAIAILPYIAIIAFITGAAMKIKTDKNA